MSMFGWWGGKPPPPGAVPFCGEWIPPWLQCLGFLISGMPGSGKSSLIAGLLGAAAANGDSGSAVAADDNLAPVLKARIPRGHGVVNVFEVHVEGGCAMDIQQDVTTQSERVEFAQKLAPAEGGGHNNANFFNLWVQIVIVAALHVLHTYAKRKIPKEGTWGLADVVRLCKDHYLLSQAGEHIDGVGDIFKSLGHHGDTARDVQATIMTKLSKVAVYAALMEKAPRKASVLKALKEGRGWNVYRWVDRFASTQAGLFSYALDTEIEYALSRVSDKRHWLGCDEIVSMAPLKGLVHAARRGRKSGIVPVVSFHEMFGFHETYGRNKAEEICALMAFKAFLKCGSPDMGEWCSRYLGTLDILQRVHPGYVMPPTDPAHVERFEQSVREWRNFSPDQLRRLSYADPTPGADGIKGFADFADRPPFPFETKFLHFFKDVPRVEAKKPVDPEHEVLADINDREWITRVGIPPEVVEKAREKEEGSKS